MRTPSSSASYRVLLPLFSCLLIVLATPTAGYELRLNCGGGAYTTVGGKHYQADQAYVPGSGGYTTFGFADDTWQTVGGTPDVPLIETLRGNCAYRFDVPDGPYLVTLHICDFWSHGPRQNQYDVLFDGVEVISDLDCFERAGKNFAQIFRFNVDVTDGDIDITFHIDQRHTYIGAISVESRTPDGDAPAPPTGAVAYGSYEKNSVSWDDHDEDDVAGYNIYRKVEPSGPWITMTDEPVQVSFYHDPWGIPGFEYRYGIRAVDAYGNEGDMTETNSVITLAITESTLPLYEIFMNLNDFDELNSDQGVTGDDYFPATFVHDTQVFQNIGVRYRGNVIRKLPKKSWKVRFNENELFDGAERINLNSEWPDPTLLREMLAYNVYDATRVPYSWNRYINLMVNGDYFGLHNNIQQVDQVFLIDNDLDPDGNLYKCFSNLSVLPNPEDYIEAYEKKTNEGEGHDDIIAFIELLNSVNAATFYSTFAPILDIEEAIEWYSVNVLLSNWDFTMKNYYMYHDLADDYWTILPWDMDFSFGKHNILDNQFDPDGSLIIGSGHRLAFRIISTPALRRKHAENLIRFARGRFSSETMDPKIDEGHAALYGDALMDMIKNGWDDNSMFLDGPDGLKGYVTGRCAYIEAIAPSLINDDGLVINEFMARNASTIMDESSEYEDWIEIYNGSPDTLDLTGMFLTDDPLDSMKWEIPALELLPAGYALFWADTDTLQGPHHTNFKLAGGGEWVGLFASVADGNVPIDFTRFGAQQYDVSIGRTPDGDLYWTAYGNPSPGGPAGGGPNLPPAITGTTHVPTWPGEEDSVLVTATINDDDGLVETLLFYDAGAGADSLIMFDDGLHGDGGADDDVYGATIEPLPDGTSVDYWIRATDGLSVTATDPPGAPDSTHFYQVAYVLPQLSINEFLADNETVNQDEAGEYDDWVEIYNGGAGTVNLGVMDLTDDLADSTQWTFPDTTLGPGGFLLVWCDNDLGQGPLHANFKLGASGEEIGLYDRAVYGGGRIDTIVFGQQLADISYGRYPDGADTLQFFPIPTPGSSNAPGNLPPHISDTWITPNPPPPNYSVLLTTEIIDDSALLQTLVYHAVDDGSPDWSSSILYDDGSHGDGLPGDNVYGTALPPNPDSTVVLFYVFAEDELNVTSTDPPDGAADPYRYLVGYDPPAISLNEILADNRTTNQDEALEFDDWVELFNASSDTVQLGGMYLTDNFANPRLWTLPDTSIAPGEFLLIWTDNDPEQGALHTNFGLSALGEEIGLYDTSDYFFAVIDTFSFGPQMPDTSYGRYPDGSENLVFMDTPTPGGSNMVIAVVESPFMAPVFAMAPTFPNPFTTIAKIRYSLAGTGPIRLRVYDVRGRLVRTLVDGPGTSGHHRIVWNGLDDQGLRSAPGVYFVELRSDGRQLAKKLVRLR